MIRVTNLDESLDFFCNKMGLKEIDRKENEKGRYTLAFVAAEGQENCALELTHNWDPEEYSGGRNFGHVAYEVDNIYDYCERLMSRGVIINRPPRDGWMAFIKSPDNISIEILQKGPPLNISEPWASMENISSW
jgi:lactoylglutathione lyase